ncbi:MAG TPA: site-2 protease family protein [Hyphomicrobiaceae bacterium]|nr:site-2 protease family protein [Hyphomicrobiaceae bacterium]
MAWSIPLGRILGVAIRVHMTFFLLLAWLAATYWAAGGPAVAAYGVMFVVLLFGCVVLHELGHAMAARSYGIRTEGITLLPIGGVAALERMPEKPAQEISVAIAGPLVNVVIAAILLIVLGGTLDFARLEKIPETNITNLATRLAAANIVLAVFNMIPAFPMDGGRVFRALLGYLYTYSQATRIAARVGQMVAFLFALLGLLGNPLLILIAMFIFFAASAESNAVSLREAARGRRATDAMITSFESLRLDASIDDAAGLILSTTQQEFPVVSGTEFRGIITREAIITALGQSGGRTLVEEAMTADLTVVPEDLTLEEAVKLLEQPGRTAVAVADRNHRFSGYITLENIAEFLMIRSARETREFSQKTRW